MCFYSSVIIWDPGARFTSVRSNSIIDRAADAVGVKSDNDRRRGLFGSDTDHLLDHIEHVVKDADT
jgi:hypothetical protein